jgi:Transposase Tn5 dimerisation domain
MKLENFTDFQIWAVEQWGDAYARDSRRTQRAIARLGGFLGRKSDGLPGWQTLWRGWLRLQDMCWAADFITQTL